MLLPSAGLIPINQEILVLFVTHCHVLLKLSATTIKSYLCAIRFRYVQHGFRNPLCHPDGSTYLRLHSICRAIKRTQGCSSRPRLPLTANIIQRLCSALRHGVFNPYTDLLLETLFIVAFFGFLRCGEFTHRTAFHPSTGICVEDVCITGSKASIRLKSSKTDPFRKGIMLRLFANKDLCPISALRRYREARFQVRHLSLDPFFIGRDSRPISRQFFIAHLRDALSHIGLDCSSYCGHSFRIGAATSAAAAHVPDHLIKTLGRWTSDCYVRYIRSPETLLQQAQTLMSDIGLSP